MSCAMVSMAACGRQASAQVSDCWQMMLQNSSTTFEAIATTAAGHAALCFGTLHDACCWVAALVDNQWTLIVPLPDAGLDWDELEEQARADDREHDFSDEDEEVGRKRKSKGSGAAAGKKARR